VKPLFKDSKANYYKSRFVGGEFDTRTRSDRPIVSWKFRWDIPTILYSMEKSQLSLRAWFVTLRWEYSYLQSSFAVLNEVNPQSDPREPITPDSFLNLSVLVLGVKPAAGIDQFNLFIFPDL